MNFSLVSIKLFFCDNPSSYHCECMFLFFIIKIIILQMQPNDSLNTNHLTIVHHEPIVKYLCALKEGM
jgi:hypothetical protein